MVYPTGAIWMETKMKNKKRGMRALQLCVFSLQVNYKQNSTNSKPMPGMD